MSLSVLLAGGGTAGHVGPLLSLADCLRRRDPGTVITALGTAEGLESRLVPEAGYRLALVPRVPLPRKPTADLGRLPGRLRAAVASATTAIRDSGAQVVVGFGGYVATPAYLAARRLGLPIVVHEANARPGLANRLGARFATYVAVTFPGTPLRGAQVLGLPMRRQVTMLNRATLRAHARMNFGLHPDLTTLLIYGGSLGAQRLNRTFGSVAGQLGLAGIQVLHSAGGGKTVDLAGRYDGAPPYQVVEYIDQMDLAYAAADVVVCRAGAGTVCEVTAVGLPAVYVPLPIGNGEQRFNAQPVVEAGGGLLIDDAACTPEWVSERLIPLLSRTPELQAMGAAAAAFGIRDGDERLADLVQQAVGRGGVPR